MVYISYTNEHVIFTLTHTQITKSTLFLWWLCCASDEYSYIKLHTYECVQRFVSGGKYVQAIAIVIWSMDTAIIEGAKPIGG
jgi:hypothetical protein